MSLIGSIEKFEDSNCDFASYIERFEQLLIVNGVEDDKKLPLFITLVGGETFGRLKNLCVPNSPLEKTYEECITLLKDYYSPTKLEILERFKFHKRDQKPHESIADYIVELKHLARTCNFGQFLSEALRDRLICGMTNANIQKKLLSGEKITLEEACKIAMSMELASEETRALHDVAGLRKDGNNADINKSQCSNHQKNAVARSWSFNSRQPQEKQLSQPNKLKPLSTPESALGNPNCYRCGRRHNVSTCPAINWSCFYCKKRVIRHQCAC